MSTTNRRDGGQVIRRGFPDQARCLWAGKVEATRGFVMEAWQIGGQVVILQQFLNARGEPEGWEVYGRVCKSGRIDATLFALGELTGIEPHITGDTHSAGKEKEPRT